jgi:hypothetical protein
MRSGILPFNYFVFKMMFETYSARKEESASGKATGTINLRQKE